MPTFTRRKLPVSMANVAGIPIGTIFPYVCKRPPNGAYLLNGQTITNCSTLYPKFWEWINAEVSAGYIRAVADNATFDAEVSAKGNCGAFVLNAGGVTGAIRLPLIWDGFIMGASSDQQGQTLAAGLPNITGTFNAHTFTDTVSGAFSNGEDGRSGNYVNGATMPNTVFDASDSNAIYGASSTVQPPAVRFPYCRQGYHATSPLSEQQAAQLASEMQIRADTGLSNLTELGKFKISGAFSAHPSGYAWLPSGMIIQWGESQTSATEGEITVTFPVTFPNRCFTVVAGTQIAASTEESNLGKADCMIQVLGATTSGATLYKQNIVSNPVWIKGCWIAIGY